MDTNPPQPPPEKTADPANTDSPVMAKAALFAAAGVGTREGARAFSAGAGQLLSQEVKAQLAKAAVPMAEKGLNALAPNLGAALKPAMLAQVEALAPRAVQIGAGAGGELIRANAGQAAGQVAAGAALAGAGEVAEAAAGQLVGNAAKAVVRQTAVAGARAVLGGAGIGAIMDAGIETVVAGRKYANGEIDGRQFAGRVAKQGAKGGITGGIATGAAFAVSALVGGPALLAAGAGIGVAVGARLAIDHLWR